MTLDERLTVVVHELQRRANNLLGSPDPDAQARAGGLMFAADKILAELERVEISYPEAA